MATVCTYRLPEEDKQALASMAQAEGIPPATLVKQLVQARIYQFKAKNPSAGNTEALLKN